MLQIESRIQFFSKRKPFKSFSGILFLMFIISTIIISSVFLVKRMEKKSYFSISKLIVTGKFQYINSNDIIEAILSTGSPKTLMLKNVNIISQQIKQCLPTIRYINVYKQLPHTLRINILEYIPLAIWNDSYLMDNNGFFFNVPNESNLKKNILNFYGPEGSQKDILSIYKTIFNVVKNENVKINSLLISTRHTWQLIMDDNVCFILGKDNFIKRFCYLIFFYHDLKNPIRLQDHRVNYIDLRYELGISIKWKN